MLIVMKPNATASEIDAVVNVVEAVGFRAHPMPGATRTAIGITGNEGPVDGRRFENLAGVAEVIRVTKPSHLITLDLRPDKTVVRVGDATVGGQRARDYRRVRARSRVANRRSRSRRQCTKVVRVSFVAVFGSLERRLTPSRASAKKAGESWQPFARSSA